MFNIGIFPHQTTEFPRVWFLCSHCHDRSIICRVCQRFRCAVHELDEVDPVAPPPSICEFLQKPNCVRLSTIWPHLSDQNFRFSTIRKEVITEWKFKKLIPSFFEEWINENFDRTSVVKSWTTECKLIFVKVHVWGYQLHAARCSTIFNRRVTDFVTVENWNAAVGQYHRHVQII